MSRPHLEFLAEINNQSFAQNVEWFSTDLKIYYRPKEVIMNMATAQQKSIQITFDGGSTWVDFATTKKFDFIDQIRFVIRNDDLVNFRCTDGSGVTVSHLHIYFKEF